MKPEVSEPPPVAAGEPAAAEAGPMRNTVLQLASQIFGAVFTATLTLYLVRALGAGRYGVYALAISISGLVLYPAGLGLPWSVGRFLADHLGDRSEVRAIFTTGLKLQLPAAGLAAVALFAVSSPVAHAYANPHLVWPLRWAAVSVIGQALFAYLTSAGASIRRVSVSLYMAILESAVETGTAIGLVVAGTAAAGAVLGKAIGYSVAAAAGLVMMARLLGRSHRHSERPRRVSTRTITRYAGAMFVVDLTWTAVAQLDVLLIGAVLTATAVGRFSAVTRVLIVLGYLGTAVAAGVAPRLSLGGGAPDTRLFEQALRYLVIAQGLVIAPMLVWAHPIVDLLLGPGYGHSAAIMRVLTLYYFIGGPAALITVAVTYLGEARRRVTIMVSTLAIGLVVTYLLLRAVGVVGAAIADDLIQIAYVGGHVWICSRLVTVGMRRLAWATVRTVMAAAAMALVLLAFGTHHLSAAQWLLGGTAGLAAYLAVLLLSREVSAAELRTVATRVRDALRRPPAAGRV